MAEESRPQQQTGIAFAEFLESSAPGSEVTVNDLVLYDKDDTRYLARPEIQLHCPSPKCSGTRFFKAQGPSVRFGPSFLSTELLLSYRCRNCEQSRKVYALALLDERRVSKIGEMPAFGPPIPSRVISLVGPDRETFIRGRRAENQGLGIGAFAYYRRVVENQWQRFLDEIIRVSEQTGVPTNVTDTLRKARSETQFSRAVHEIKSAIPEALTINGHNPVTLLHQALSRGLHAGSEEECLEMATTIRMVLFELADRLGHLLKNERELKDAITRLVAKPALDCDNKE